MDLIMERGVGLREAQARLQDQRQQSTQQGGSIKQVGSTRGRAPEKLHLYKTIAFVVVAVGR